MASIPHKQLLDENTSFSLVRTNPLLTGNLKNSVKEKTALFRKHGWKKAVVVQSNRKKYNYDPDNIKIVYTLHIKDCIHKGY